MKTHVVVPHCRWDADRRKHLAEHLVPRLRDVGEIFVFDGPGPVPPHVWFERIRAWALTLSADDVVLQVQDDALVADEFVSARLKIKRVLGDQATVSHFNVMPWAVQVHGKGGRFMTSRDLLPGVAWEMPARRLQEHHRWILESIRGDSSARMGEDALLGLFHASQRIPIWHPLPCLVDHADFGSQHDHDTATIRRAFCSFRDVKVGEYVLGNPLPAELGEDAPHFGRQDPNTLYRFCRFVRPYDGWEDRADEIERDHVHVTMTTNRE